MTDLFENPIGLDGFEFVEFSAPEKGVLEPVFKAMGFTHVAHHRSKDVQLWRQGDINLVTNYEPGAPGLVLQPRTWCQRLRHGLPRQGCAPAPMTNCSNAAAEPVQLETGPMELRLPAIRGIGNAIIYLVDRYERGRARRPVDL